MSFPFKIIESKITSRNEFEMVNGCQPTHALFYLKEGEFIAEIDGAKEIYHAGDCAIFPNYIHFRRSVLAPIVFIYIKFSYEPNHTLPFELPYGKVTFKDKERFLSSITTLERLLDSNEPFADDYREHLLTDILLQVYSEKSPTGIPFAEHQNHDAYVISATTYITKNLDKKIAIEDICHALGTNASSLNFKFRRHLNMSVGEFITSERMKKARSLLTYTTYSLSEIALRCGYANVYYFSNAFKKENSMSPSAYRKSSGVSNIF